MGVTNKGNDNMNIDLIVKQYMETAVWADADENAEGMAIHPEAWVIARIDCEYFYNRALAAGYLVDITDPTDIGHNLWLSRNGHGAGFFDKDFKFAKELQELAQQCGARYLYEGDDNHYHLS